MSYIVKNCPACNNYEKDRYTCSQLYDTDMDLCRDYTKCVIKQVIEKCKDDWEDITVDKFQKELLQLFDIEEISE